MAWPMHTIVVGTGHHNHMEDTMMTAEHITHLKSDAIAKANRLGSRASTVRGALRVLRQQDYRRIPRWPGLALDAVQARLAAGTYRPPAPPDHGSVADYRYTRRGERICVALGLPMDYQDRLAHVEWARQYAADHGATQHPEAAAIWAVLVTTSDRVALRQQVCRLYGFTPALVAELDRLALEAADRLEDDWPLRRSRSTWAGGYHRVTVRWVLDGSAVAAEGYSTTVWSANGKWSGTDSTAELTVSVRALRRYPTLRTPDGLIVLDYVPLDGQPRTAKLTWVEQGKGVTLKAISGYLVRGYHVVASSLTVAVRKVTAIRRAACATMLQARIQQRQDLREYRTVWVGVADSLAGGNCPSGTEAYRRQLSQSCGGDIGGIRADHLLRLRRDVFTLRAVRAAVARMGHRLAQPAMA